MARPKSPNPRPRGKYVLISAIGYSRLRARAKAEGVSMASLVDRVVVAALGAAPAQPVVVVNTRPLTLQEQLDVMRVGRHA